LKKLKKSLFYICASLIIILQIILCLHQIASYWQWGHNGYNGAAALQSARNTLRWGSIWPVQYHTADTKPSPSQYYTHAPQGLYWLVTISVAIFGDTELAVRIAPSIFSVLAALMLLIFLSKHYSRKTALIATLIYVMLPINSIYCNMSNHSTPNIFFALLMFDGYLEWKKKNRKRYLFECLAGFFGSLIIDWPGYTMGICLGIFAFYTALKPAPYRGFLFRKQILFALFIIATTLILFKGFFYWVEKTRGLDDLMNTLTERSSTTSILQSISNLYGTAVDYMYPKIVRLPAMAWLIGIFIMHAMGKFKESHIAPLSFFVGAMGQYLLFPVSTILHHYWIWLFNPFVAIACAQVIEWVAETISLPRKLFISEKISATFIILTWGIPLILFFAIYSPLAYNKFKEAREVAGSLGIPNYTRDYEKIMFAKVVNNWTSRHDGIAIHTSISHRIEVEATLDRTWVDVNNSMLKNLPDVLSKDRKWVLIGKIEGTDLKALSSIATDYLLITIDSFYFLDMRKKSQGISAYDFVPQKADFWWKFFVTPYDPPLKPVRNKEKDEKIRSLIFANKETQTEKTEKHLTSNPLQLPPKLNPKFFELNKKDKTLNKEIQN